MGTLSMTTRREVLLVGLALPLLPYLPLEEVEVIRWIAQPIPNSDAVWLYAHRVLEGSIMRAMSIPPRLMTGLEFIEAGDIIEFT